MTKVGHLLAFSKPRRRKRVDRISLSGVRGAEATIGEFLLLTLRRVEQIVSRNIRTMPIIPFNSVIGMNIGNRE
jgi:hypothetical protein